MTAHSRTREDHRVWNPYNSGATVGDQGSEHGVILLDDEHTDGARITLERDCRPTIPFAITCGIYGLLVHTRFFGEEIEARTQFDQMKNDLAVLVEQLPDCGAGVPEDTIEALDEFVHRYP